MGVTVRRDGPNYYVEAVSDAAEAYLRARFAKGFWSCGALVIELEERDAMVEALVTQGFEVETGTGVIL